MANTSKRKHDSEEFLDVTKEIDIISNKEKKQKKEEKVGMGTKIYNIIKLTLFLFTAVVCVLFAFSAIKTKMIPSKFITTLIVVLLVVNLVIGLMELTKKKWINIIGILLIAIISPALLVATGYLNRTMNVLESIVSQKEEKTAYYVLTSKGEFKDVNELVGKNVGVLTQERNIIEDEVSKKVSLTYKEYDVIGDLLIALELNEIDAMIISVSLYEYIIEENGELSEILDKILEVEVVGKPTQITSDIDVGNSFIIYLSGIDTRDTSSLYTYALSDVNILIAVNPTTHKVLLVHIPRDYYVQLHGKSGLKDKLTHAGLYGIDMSMNTIADLFNIKLTTYVKVNFGAVTTIVNDIGGIDVYSDITFNSSHIKGWVVSQGMNHMDGAKALAFARERYAYASGDRHRGENQEAVIQAIIKKVSTNKEYLLQYDKILGDISPYFATNFNLEDVQELIRTQVDSLSPWTVESYNVNGGNSYNYTYSFPSQNSYVMMPNQSTIDTAKSKIFDVMSGK